MTQKQKIDSFMLCSQMDSLTTEDTSSTISFGRCLKKQKSKHPSKQPNNQKTDFTEQRDRKDNKITLKQIFNHYQTDPFSAYVLQFKTKSLKNQFKIQKKINEQFGKYTTSIQKQDYQRLLCNHSNIRHKQNESYQMKQKRQEFQNFGSLLKSIQNKNQQISEYSYQQNNIKNQREFSFIRSNFSNSIRNHGLQESMKHKQRKEINICDYQNKDNYNNRQNSNMNVINDNHKIYQNQKDLGQASFKLQSQQQQSEQTTFLQIQSKFNAKQKQINTFPNQSNYPQNQNISNKTSIKFNHQTLRNYPNYKFQQNSSYKLKQPPLTDLNMNQNHYYSQKQNISAQNKQNKSNLVSPSKQLIKKQFISPLRKSIKKQFLSPLKKQNPQKNIHKIKNLYSGQKQNYPNYQGFVEGLEFSKKLRKKTFKHKNLLNQKQVTNEFSIKNTN